MFPSSSYVWNPYEKRPHTDISISPMGEPAATLSDGDINLYPQASKIFVQLGANNNFTGQVNSFQEICVQRIHVLADHSPRSTTKVDHSALVRRHGPYTLGLHGRTVAQTSKHNPCLVATECKSLLADLSVKVQDAQHRIEELERRITNSTDGSAILTCQQNLGTHT